MLRPVKAPELNHDMHGKITLVTGATNGIGKEIARGLARMGAEVIIGSRDMGRGEEARKQLVADTKNQAISVLQVDMANTVSVRRFAAEVLAKAPKLHVLINNAGAWSSERRETSEGHEVTFATNVLGPYLLTVLLLDALRAAGNARIVNVASSFADFYDLNDLEFKNRKWDGMKAYKQTKQALRMLTGGFATKLKDSGITVNDAHPGFVKTAFNRDVTGFQAVMINFFANIMAASPTEGADTPLWMATAPELAGVTGKFFHKRKEGDPKFRDPAAFAELERALSAMAGV
jgi:NAD(P)-dependent dehydrogenase (short-subunit alcohol dehydrogenase family)